MTTSRPRKLNGRSWRVFCTWIQRSPKAKTYRQSPVLAFTQSSSSFISPRSTISCSNNVVGAGLRMKVPTLTMHLAWRRGLESNESSGLFQNSLLAYYRPTTRGVPPHNCRTPIESGIFECVSRTRHYGSNTNQLLTNYPFTTGSLALFAPQINGRFETLAFTPAPIFEF
jgi:hypothetical protein